MDQNNKLNLGELIALLSGLAFILTVVYIYGLSSSIGVNIQQYISINDYLSYSVKWLTPILATLSITVIFHLLTKRIEKGASEEEIIANSNNPNFTRKFRKITINSFPIILLVIALLDAVLYFFGIIPKYMVYSISSIALPALWLLFAEWYIKVPKLTQNWDIIFLKLFIYIPAILIFTFFYGLYQGDLILNKENVISLYLVNNQNSVSGKLIITLDKYIILKDESLNKFKIIPTSNVLIMEKNTDS